MRTGFCRIHTDVRRRVETRTSSYRLPESILRFLRRAQTRLLIIRNSLIFLLINRAPLFLPSFLDSLLVVIKERALFSDALYFREQLFDACAFLRQFAYDFFLVQIGTPRLINYLHSLGSYSRTRFLPQLKLLRLPCHRRIHHIRFIYFSLNNAKVSFDC